LNAQADTENNALIQYRGLSKQYGQRILLTDVSLDCYRSQCFLLTGDNGSGKSTLLRIMSGLLKPDAGTVALNSKQMLSWPSQQDALRNHVMYMHQSPYLFDGSVIKNLEYAFHNSLGNRTERTIQDALQWSNLEALSKNSAKQLSGGEKQRVALARAWLRNANLLLLDEPTANLDQTSRLKTIDLLRSLKNTGVSLVIACHEYQEFTDISDGILQLENGLLRKI